MLALSRRPKPGQREINLRMPDGRLIVVTLISVHKGQARIGVTAPADVPVVRGEIAEKVGGER